jgi:hypothetical protein
METKFYSFKGYFPIELPNYWRFDDGTVRTDLQELSDEDLETLGWIGSIEMPPLPGTSYHTHSYEWNSDTLRFDAVELDEFEKKRRVNYQEFWDNLIEGGLVGNWETQEKTGTSYKTIKEYSKQSLEINTIVTEFVTLISDAKRGYANVTAIQNSIYEILNNIPLSQNELKELKDLFDYSGMSAIYKLEITT